MTKVRLLMVFALCALWPASAHAQWDFLDWAQPGSGPGPYRGNFGLFTRAFCIKSDGAKSKAAWCFTDTDENIRIVVEAQYGHSTSDNPRFNDPVAKQELPLNNASVTIDTFDASYSYRVSAFLDVGVAIGSLTYSGQGFPTDSHLTLTPLRVSFVPLAFIYGKYGKEAGRLLKINYFNRRIVGDVTAKKFGSDSDYVQRGEFNQGISVGIDGWNFIAMLFHKK